MDRSYFEKMLEDSQISLSDRQFMQFDRFYELLIEWNKVMNLTGITEYKEVVLKHYIDSIIVTKYFDFSKVSRVIDVGTGAGFPGIPLKILLPDVQFDLLDSLNKRINFLNAVTQECNLSGIKAVHARAEDYARNKENRESYDLCVSRAVSNLSTLSEYCLPFVSVGGHFISYKAGNMGDELKDAQNAIKLLGGNISEVVNITLPNSDIERTFVIIEKIKNTSGKFPRKSGIPAKEPLK